VSPFPLSPFPPVNLSAFEGDTSMIRYGLPANCAAGDRNEEQGINAGIGEITRYRMNVVSRLRFEGNTLKVKNAVLLLRSVSVIPGGVLTTT